MDKAPELTEGAVGMALLALRVKSQLTLRDLANLTGLSQAALSRIETGQRGIELLLAQRMVTIYGTTLDELFKLSYQFIEAAERIKARRGHVADMRSELRSEIATHTRL